MITSCPYPSICNNPSCEKEPYQRCFVYNQILSQQIDVAVQYYLDNKLTVEDWEWLAQHFNVPLSKLERHLLRV